MDVRLSSKELGRKVVVEECKKARLFHPYKFVYGDVVEQVAGITKREWFAGMALQGILSDLSGNASYLNGNLDPDFIANHTIKYVDALMARLEK